MHRRPPSPASWCSLLVVLALALVGCSAGVPGAVTGASSSKHRSADPTTTAPVTPPPAPSVSECRDLQYADISAYANQSPPVPCSKPHTAYTFRVATLPSDVAFPGVQIQNRAVQDAAATDCRNGFAAFIGGTAADRALSRLSVTYFLPSQQGFDAGAHWVRCDVVALKSEHALAPLPDRLAHFLDRPANVQAYAVCSRGRPGSNRAKLLVCTQHHDYRAIAALRLGRSGAPYPGQAVDRVQGQQRCANLLAQRLGPSGGYTYSWTFPSAQDWSSSGQRFGYCWLRTPH